MPDSSAFIAQNGELTVSGSEWGDLLRAILEKEADFRFKAAGISMSPFIKNGDVLTISPLTNTLPQVGDIVAFIHPDSKKAVIHRLVDREGCRFRVKGDNIHTPGVTLAIKDILGRVTRIERNGRHIGGAAGPGRRLIAALSRSGFLFWAVCSLQRLRSTFRKGSRHE